MTDRMPALGGRRRHPLDRAPVHLRWRRPPGGPLAALLALVLGVCGAMWWAGRDSPPAFAIGAAASLGPAPLDGSGPAPLPRAGRGGPRTDQADAPAHTASDGPASDGLAPDGPARPSRTVTLATAAPGPPAPARTFVPLAPGPTSPGPGQRTPATGAGAVAGEVLRLTNAERAAAGCGPLHADSRLAAAAQGHSADMASRRYFSHITPEGTTPWDRAREAGYDTPSAENIAMGYRTPADVVVAWMRSQDHRQNILNCSSHALGVGFDPRGYYWTQLFGYV